jgi:hypothetical protein
MLGTGLGTRSKSCTVYGTGEEWLAEPILPECNGAMRRADCTRGGTIASTVAADIDHIASDDSTHSGIAALSPPGAGTDSLRVSAVARFNQKNLPMMPRSMTVDGESKPVKYTNVVADANLDDSVSSFSNPTISFDETEGLPGQPALMPDRTWATVVEQLYRILGTVADTRVELKPVQIDDGQGGNPTASVPPSAGKIGFFRKYPQPLGNTWAGLTPVLKPTSGTAPIFIPKGGRRTGHGGFVPLEWPRPSESRLKRVKNPPQI